MTELAQSFGYGFMAFSLVFTLGSLAYLAWEGIQQLRKLKRLGELCVKESEDVLNDARVPTLKSVR